MITLCNASCGIMAILLGDPVVGSYLVLLAMILDTFDGLAARLLDVTSDLGKQLDSLSDLISFGVAPAYLYYTFFTDMEALLACIFYILSALFRLAKFNTLEYQSDFNGLPSPAAAGILAGYVLLYAFEGQRGFSFVPLLAIIAPAICMNIQMRFFSLKSDTLLSNWRIWAVTGLTIASVFIDWHYALLVCFGTYLIISICDGLARKTKRMMAH